MVHLANVAGDVLIMIALKVCHLQLWNDHQHVAEHLRALLNKMALVKSLQVVNVVSEISRHEVAALLLDQHLVLASNSVHLVLALLDLLVTRSHVLCDQCAQLSKRLLLRVNHLLPFEVLDVVQVFDFFFASLEHEFDFAGVESDTLDLLADGVELKIELGTRLVQSHQLVE